MTSRPTARGLHRPRVGPALLGLVALGLIAACARRGRPGRAERRRGRWRQRHGGARAGAGRRRRAPPRRVRRAGGPPPVTITLDWVGYQPHHMAFWLAKERGWYRDRGLDVSIQDARGSGQVVQLPTAGQTDFGLVTAIVDTQSVAKGAPLQMVGVFTQQDNTALKYLHSSGIRGRKTWKDGRWAWWPAR